VISTGFVGNIIYIYIYIYMIRNFDVTTETCYTHCFYNSCPGEFNCSGFPRISIKKKLNRKVI
jgi:hypothetical protein